MDEVSARSPRSFASVCAWPWLLVSSDCTRGARISIVRRKYRGGLSRSDAGDQCSRSLRWSCFVVMGDTCYYVSNLHSSRDFKPFARKWTRSISGVSRKVSGEQIVCIYVNIDYWQCFYIWKPSPPSFPDLDEASNDDGGAPIGECQFVCRIYFLELTLNWLIFKLTLTYPSETNDTKDFYFDLTLV